MPCCGVNSCCGIDNVRTASIIIGYYNFIASIILLGVSVYIMQLGSGYSQKTESFYLGLLLITMSLNLILLMIFFVAFAVVLLIGIHQHKPHYVKAFLYAIVISLALLFMFLIGSCIVNVKGKESMTALVLFSIVSCIHIVLDLYFVFVVRTFYSTMCEEIEGSNSSSPTLQRRF